MVNLICNKSINSADKEGRVVLRLAHYFASSLRPPATMNSLQSKEIAKQVRNNPPGGTPCPFCCAGLSTAVWQSF